MAGTMAKPKLTTDEACTLAASSFGLSIDSVAPLPSYDDQNFRVLCGAGQPSLVLKVAASGSACRGHAGDDDTKAQLELENAAMRRLAAAGVRCPQPVPPRDPTSAGVEGDLVLVRSPNNGNGVNYARLVTFLPGEVLAKSPAPPSLLRQLGATIARCDCALGGWAPPAAVRYLSWDLAHAAAARTYLDDIDCVDDRAVADRWMSAFEALTAGEAIPGSDGVSLAALPDQVIHGDLNDYNILVETPTATTQDPQWGVSVLDFGDMCLSKRVYNLAIALAYVCQNQTDADAAVDAAAQVVAGYCATLPELSTDEVCALAVLVAARLVQSVGTSAHSVKEEPENAEYILVNAVPGWKLLRQWDEVT